MNKLEKYAKNIMKEHGFEDLIIIGMGKNRLESLTTRSNLISLCALCSVLTKQWQDIANTEKLIEADEVFEKINALSEYVESIREASVSRGGNDE